MSLAILKMWKRSFKNRASDFYPSRGCFPAQRFSNSLAGLSPNFVVGFNNLHCPKHRAEPHTCFGTAWTCRFKSSAANKYDFALYAANNTKSHRPSMLRSAAFATYRNIKRGFVADDEDDEVDDDELTDVFFDQNETEVAGYFSKLYGRGSLLAQDEGFQATGGGGINNEIDSSERDELDEEYMGFEGYHSGMTQDRKERWLRKRIILAQKGRLWEDPLHITDEEWSSETWWEDLPDWTPEVISAEALNRVIVLDKVLTLHQLSTLPLPPPAPVVPAHEPKKYAAYRQEVERTLIASKVRALADTRVQHILQLDSEFQQDAIDELFELVEAEMRQAQGVLAIERETKEKFTQPPQAKFELMVEDALSDYLKEVYADQLKKSQSEQDKKELQSSDQSQLITDQTAKPVFMDVFKSSLGKDRVYAVTGASGGIVEEWDMSANKNTRRILLRRCIREVAKHIVEAENNTDNPATKIFVKGHRGVGKVS